MPNATAAILDMIQPEVTPFNPPPDEPPLRTKHEADRINHCRDMAI